MNWLVNDLRMELSVIIVSFNVRDYLRQCLISAMIASEKVNYEILVVDNNSEDGSVEMVTNEFPGVKLITNKVNWGFSVANNQAIKMSEGDFILLLNPDTIVERDTFSRCIKFMNCHPDAGAMGIRMINGKGSFLPESKRAFPTPASAFFKIFGLSSLFPGSKLLNSYYLPHIDDVETSITEVISGAFMLIRHEALDQSGLFDEDFFMYGEDIDLSYRLLQTGYNNYYVPEIQIVHFKGKSTGKDNFNDLHHFYRSMRIYLRKRADEGKFRTIKIILLIAIYFREGLAVVNRSIKLTFHG